MKLAIIRCFAPLLVAVAAPMACSSTNQAAAPSTADAGDDGAQTRGEAGPTPGPAPGEAGTPSGGDSGQTPATACDAINLAPPASGSGVQYQIAQTLEAGQERQVCQLVKLGQDLDMNWSKGIMTTGSHHGLVYRTAYNGSIPATTLDGQTLDGTQVHACSTPSALWDTGAVVAGSQGNQDSFPQGTLPSNVAVKLKAGDYLVLNFHLLNATSQTLNACYKVNLIGVPDSQVTQEAGLLFWYNPFITVPANGTSTARMTCPITQDINLAFGVSHAHMRLSNYVATLMTADPEAGGTKVQDLYTGTAWDSPAPKLFSPALAITKGHWIDYHCDYTNLEARNVAQGQWTTDEMCMFVGAYWPRDPNLDTCVSANGHDYLGGHSYGYGTKTGADFLSCFWNTPQPTGGGGPASSDSRYAAYGCITQTCPKASGPITPYIDCIVTNNKSCQTQCTTLQSSFQAICASTPASTTTGPDGGATSAKDGCKAEYGTNGSDGTCAAQGQAAAVTGCTTAAQVTELTKQCQQTFCSSACSGDAGAGDAGTAACAACVGQFTGNPSNPTCLNQLTLACVADQTKKAASACVTQCFTDCITTRVSSCTVDCLNQTACKTEFGTVAAATCN
jgi:hypothetical protein